MSIESALLSIMWFHGRSTNTDENFDREAELARKRVGTDISNDAPKGGPTHKSYPRFPVTLLPCAMSCRASLLQDLLRARRSCRSFSSGPLSLDEMSTLLAPLSETKVASGQAKRGYPSGGAKYPVEAYIASYRVSGLRGHCCYHYRPDQHGLEEMWDFEEDRFPVERFSPDSDAPAAVIFLTAILARSIARYSLKSYPLALIEAGAVAQSIQLASAGSRLGSYLAGGFVGSRVSQLLDLPDDELPVLAIPVGRPRDEYVQGEAT